ncbi:MAG: YceI family protein [Saprospiraceae bacterium]
MKKLPILIVSFILLSAFSPNNTASWRIADDFSVSFKTKKAKGNFTTLQGQVIFDENDLANASFQVEVEVASIQAGNWLKTRHAKGGSWFDADEYPTIKFSSKEVRKSKEAYLVSGDLTLHGITKEITIPFDFKQNKFQGSFTVNRLDYEVGTIKGMSKSVGTAIKIDLSVPVTN